MATSGLRMKWYGLKIPKGSLAALGKFMLQMQYVPGSTSGFRMSSVRRDLVAGEYVERREYEEEVRDPFGVSISITQVEFRRVEFWIRAGSSLIEVRHSTRDVKLLFSRLVEFYGDSMDLHPAQIDVLEWLKQVEAEAGRVRVLAARVVGMALSSTVAATISIEGTSDVRSQLEQFRGGRSGIVDRLRIASAVSSRIPWEFELASDCRMTASGDEETVVAIGREAVQRVHQLSGS